MNKTLRASGKTQEHAYRNGPKITEIETAVPREVMPGLLQLRIQTVRASFLCCKEMVSVSLPTPHYKYHVHKNT